MAERARAALESARVLARAESRNVPTQAGIAERIGMTPDALSRALNGSRQFTAGETAAFADAVGADLLWLITGQADPFRPFIAARHDYDSTTGARSVPSRDEDNVVVRGVELAYRQAYQYEPATREPATHGPASREPATHGATAHQPTAPPDEHLPGHAARSAGVSEATFASGITRSLCTSPDRLRGQLGDDFVRWFAARLSERVGIDVVRHPDVSTAWSMELGGHAVIIIPASGNWFRENWSLAHESAHLCLGHARDDAGSNEMSNDAKEAAANSFAAELLLPADRVRSLNWQSIDGRSVADMVWDWGVSTDALKVRLDYLRISRSHDVDTWLGYTTRQLLRRFRPELQAEEVERTSAAAVRSFPLALMNRHEQKVLGGTLGAGTLAWMLGVHAGGLEVQGPEPQPHVDSDALMAMLDT